MVRLRGFWRPRILIAVSIAIGWASVPGCGPDSPKISSTRLAVDADTDGMDDGWETTHFGDLSETATGDYDSDGIENLDEFTYDFDPTTDDAFDDEDGDRYPNVFEVKAGSDPTDDTDLPTADWVVDPANAATSTTDNIYDDFRDVVDKANAENDYQIIVIKEGTYTGSRNTAVTLSLGTHPLLVLGEAGAAKTIIDGESTLRGWSAYSPTVIASITIQNTHSSFGGLYLNDYDGAFRLVDVVIRNCSTNGTIAGAISANAFTDFQIVHSTLIDNTSATGSTEQLYVGGSGSFTLTNSVVWGESTGDHFSKHTSTTFSATHSLIKGETLSGTGNLAGTTDPKLNPGGKTGYDSPLVDAGLDDVPQSRVDWELEARPALDPDIGADQFVDTDSDDLADSWELEHAGNLTTLTSRTADNDSDGLDNAEEFEAATDPTDSDTDDDTLSDGDEVDTHGTNPLTVDTDADGMPDDWEVDQGLDPTNDDALADEDGDGYPNIFEYKGSSDADDSSSKPTADRIVDPANADNSPSDNIYDSIRNAYNAANQAGDYQIIAIVAGTYSGTFNVNLIFNNSHPFLFIGVDGAKNTVIDGLGVDKGHRPQKPNVFSSLTFTRMKDYAIYVPYLAGELRFSNVLFLNNAGENYAGAIDATNFEKLYLTNCSLINNSRSGTGTGAQVELGPSYSGELFLENTIIWSDGSEDLLDANTGYTITANNSLVKGETLSGGGNLSGTTDPRIRTRDSLLFSDSPLIDAGAGGMAGDFQLENRDSSPDIGVDEFIDSDADGLPDAWELSFVSSLTTLGLGDADGDGLSDADEFAAYADPQNTDSDDDGVQDGLEVTLGTDPIVRDYDDLATDHNNDGLIDAIGLELGYAPDLSDDDGDGISNATEIAQGTDPTRDDTDGDGTTDDQDDFPLDPTLSTLTNDPQDSTAPAITLVLPEAAVLQ